MQYTLAVVHFIGRDFERALDTLLDVDYLNHTVPWTHFLRATIYYELHKLNSSSQERASSLDKMKGAIESAVAMDCSIQNSLPVVVFKAKCCILEDDFLAAKKVHQLLSLRPCMGWFWN